MSWCALFVMILCCVTGTACSDAGSSPARSRAQLQRELEARIADAAASGFSGAILVSHEGERLAAAGYGLADRAGGAANGIETAFDAGSILKELTAAAVFNLAGQGALSLDDSLAELLPNVPADKAEITLLQVLQHSAGFHDYHDTTGDFESMGRAEARERILGQELLFPPGSDEAYSNSGYTLLADIVQERSCQSYTDYIRSALFEPAGMTQSGFYSEPLWQTVDTAIGYEDATFGANDPATWPYTWALVGNGGLVTTVLDLDRWATALLGGDVLPPSALAAYEAEFLSRGAVEIGEHTVFAHAGGNDYGFGAVLASAPGTGTRLVIATNAAPAFDIEDFAEELLVLMLE